MKIHFKPFRAKATHGVRYYWVTASNQDGSQARLLGIVRRDQAGVWTADPDMFPPKPHAERTEHRTRTRAAGDLVSAHTAKLRARTEVPA
jgi:hypothetical protein